MKKSPVYEPVPFFSIAILITWAAWFMAAYLSYQQSSDSNGSFSILMLAGLLPPFVTALGMILTSNKKELKQDFYSRLFDLKRIKPSSLPAIFLIMPLAAIVSVFLSRLFFGQSWDQLTLIPEAPSAAGLIPIPVMFFGAALMEELGWKGYGMDSLRGRRTFFDATLIYAGLWTLWHLPLFFINHYYHNTLLRENPLFALNFIVSIFPAAFIINWLWYKNRGNILTAVLVHAAANFQGLLQMGQIAKCIETVVLITVAALIVRSHKNIFFRIFPPQIGYYGFQPKRER